MASGEEPPSWQCGPPPPPPPWPLFIPGMPPPCVIWCCCWSCCWCCDWWWWLLPNVPSLKTRERERTRENGWEMGSIIFNTNTIIIIIWACYVTHKSRGAYRDDGKLPCLPSITAGHLNFHVENELPRVSVSWVNKFCFNLQIIKPHLSGRTLNRHFLMDEIETDKYPRTGLTMCAQVQGSTCGKGTHSLLFHSASVVAGGGYEFRLKFYVNLKLIFLPRNHHYHHHPTTMSC